MSVAVAQSNLDGLSRLSPGIALMSPDQRIVTRMPLAELADRSGRNTLHCIRPLSQQDVEQILRSGPISFVIADIGQPLRWIDGHEALRLRKTEIASHVIAPADLKNGVSLDRVADSFFYAASEWRAENRSPVVLLEKYH